MEISKWSDLSLPIQSDNLISAGKNKEKSSLANDPYDLDITITNQSSGGIKEVTGSENCTRASLCVCPTDTCQSCRCTGIEGVC